MTGSLKIEYVHLKLIFIAPSILIILMAVTVLQSTDKINAYTWQTYTSDIDKISILLDWKMLDFPDLVTF